MNVDEYYKYLYENVINMGVRGWFAARYHKLIDKH
jgi:hypothetical protein